MSRRYPGIKNSGISLFRQSRETVRKPAPADLPVEKHRGLRYNNSAALAASLQKMESYHRIQDLIIC